MNAVAKQKSNLGSVISSEAFKAEMAKTLPKHVTADRMSRVAVTALRRTPKLQQCTPESFYKCMMDLSQWGLEPDGRRAHLIPYGKECTLVIDYKGLAELAYRSGLVAKIHADVVYEGDRFAYDRGQVTLHTPFFLVPKNHRAKERGDCIGAYCEVELTTGARKCDVMSRDEIEAIRKRSKAGDKGPWVSDWSEMAKKTVFRRVSKWLPLSAEYREAVERDDETVIVEGRAQPALETAEQLSAALIDAPAQESGGYEARINKTTTASGLNAILDEIALDESLLDERKNELTDKVEGLLAELKG